ncbi:MAG: glutathione ABC transporter substrate-binding protein [Armatimonadota bacterium]|nr:glutathione ABC transporter substrate-binding protein [Armatimonadota bacterium]MDR7444622.1 glutathione ABC transporter substrate-binding protein [Armatimonadota bacterium]MDR7569448.1 glutathione ABC transporter substrate-binding protein [Armatimonadota bacterium]MDR7613669.1 glutathione ABC transporter substrate-binding protein [Armatimonadota bacterium]
MNRILLGVGILGLLVALSLPGQSAPRGPEPGGTLIIGRGVDSVTLSPYATAAPDAEVIAHLVETLYELTPEGRIVPKLAESMPRVSADGRTMTIRLRRGIRFHDGTPFDAYAVKWNFDFILNPENRVPFRGILLGEVTSVEVVDRYTVRLVLRRPFVPLLAHLTHDFLAIHSPAAVERAGGMRPPNGEPYGRQPVGTGPFRFREWVRGDRIVLERNPDYWGPRKPLLDQVVFRAIPDDGARVLALEGGQVHVAVRVPPRETTRLALNRALRIDRTNSVRTIFIAFNNQKFTDVRVRQAFNYAVNKRAIVQTVLGGAARVSDAPISPGIVGYAPIQPGGWPYDVNRARQLLAEAGHGGGLTVTILHPTGRYVQDAAVAAAIQAQLRAAGINARLQTMEWAAYLAYTNQPVDRTPVEMFMLGWGTVTGDADYGLYSLFHSSQWAPAGFNRAFYRNPQVDQLLDQARTETNPARRADLYRQAMILIWRDAPWIFLHSESQTTGVRREVQDLVVHPTERILAHTAWLRR